MTKPKLKKGLVQVYTGSGKGKTTAAFGLAMRARGQGLRVCLIQFLKNEPCGEMASLRKLGIRMIRFPCPFHLFDCLSKEDRRKLRDQVQQTFSQGRRIVREGQYDLVILDEINFVLHQRLIKTEEILRLMKAKPSQMELVLTGRHAPRRIIQKANLVTEMVEVKHPFRKGIKARKGIEY